MCQRIDRSVRVVVAEGEGGLGEVSIKTTETGVTTATVGGDEIIFREFFIQLRLGSKQLCVRV